MLDGEPATGQRFFGDAHAAFRQFPGIVPVTADFVDRAFVAARQARGQGVAAGVRVIHRQRRQLEVEGLPIAALAQLLQPVGAQAVGEIAAGILRKVSAHFGGGHDVEPHLELPILRIRLQHVTFERGCVVGEPDRIAGPERRMRGENGFIRARRAGRGAKRRAGGQQGQCYSIKMLANHRERITQPPSHPGWRT